MASAVLRLCAAGRGTRPLLVASPGLRRPRDRTRGWGLGARAGARDRARRAGPRIGGLHRRLAVETAAACAPSPLGREAECEARRTSDLRKVRLQNGRTAAKWTRASRPT